MYIQLVVPSFDDFVDANNIFLIDGFVAKLEFDSASTHGFESPSILRRGKKHFSELFFRPKSLQN